MINQGVGSLLKSWIPEWIKVEKRSACGCEKLRAEMDDLGPDGVENDIERFVQHFMNQRRYLRKYLQTIPESACRVWVRVMIQRACRAVRDDVQPKVGKDTRKRRS